MYTELFFFPFLFSSYFCSVDSRVVSIVSGVTGKLTKIPKRDFIFARVKTGQVGT